MNLAGKYLNFGVDASIPNLGSFVPSGTEKTFYGNPSFTQDGFTKGLTTSKDVPLDRYGRPSFIQDISSKNITLEEALAQRVLEGLNPESEKRKLENTLAFQKAQMKEALPYNLLSRGLDTLSKLPEQISANAANRAMLNVLGARSATEAFNQTMASYPKTNFQSTVPLVQRNYFT